MAKKKKNKVVPCSDVHQHDRERHERLEREKKHYANLIAKMMAAKEQQMAQNQPTMIDGMQKSEEI